MNRLFVRDDLQDLLGARNAFPEEALPDQAFPDQAFARAMSLDGQVYRAVATRRTIRFDWNDRHYFAKTHRGVGWGEILKNLVQLRPPVVSARNEFEACQRLEVLGIRAPIVAAFGERGANPARRDSFVICDALEGFENLEDFTRNWHREPPAPLESRRLVMAVADFARRFHGAGLIHRDFYLCHLLLDLAAWRSGRAELAVLDLHRARIFQRIPARWRERDLAALLFSTLDLPLGWRSWYRFVRAYTGRPLREVFARDGCFWRRVERRALALYRKGRRKGIVRGDDTP